MFDKEVVFFFLAGIGRNKQTGETKALAIYSPRKRKQALELAQYSLPYDEKAINLPIGGFLFLPGEGLVFFSFAEDKELKEIEGKKVGERKIEFGLSNSGGTVLKIPYEDGKPLSLGLPLFIPSILRALTTVSPTGSLKVLLFPKEVRRELEKKGIAPIPDVLLNREQLTLIVEVPEILPLLCRLIVASELFETFEKTYIANSNRLLKRGKEGSFLLN